MTETRVAIIGAGPAGMLLSHLLDAAGVDNVVVERQSRPYVLDRIRAGVLEWGTVETLREAGLGTRMDAEGHVHDTINMAWRGEDVLSINTDVLLGKQMMAYGQTRIQEDLYEAADARGACVIFEADNVQLHDAETDHPSVTYDAGAGTERITCDFVAGCDGSHGVSRVSIPESVRTEYEKVYPFGWLGILSETPPLPILLYANHERGFALCSMRNPMLSRYYVQTSLDDEVGDWSDDRFWDELTARLPSDVARQIVTGPSIEKSIAPLRSFVSEPMRWGSLFLAGDAAHIVPPTGAKGLNLAVSDVRYLARAFACHYGGDDTYLDSYSAMALRAGLGFGPLQLVHDQPAAPVPRSNGVRSAGAGTGALVPGILRERPALTGRAVRRPSLRVGDRSNEWHSTSPTSTSRVRRSSMPTRRARDITSTSSPMSLMTRGESRALPGRRAGLPRRVGHDRGAEAGRPRSGLQSHSRTRRQHLLRRKGRRSPTGSTYVEIVSSMTENDAAGHQAMMIAGGRSPEGNRYLHEWDDTEAQH